MSVINPKETRNYIVNWLKDYAEKAGVKSFVVGLSGGIDSALVALLCKKTNISTICIALPCHSSECSLNRADAFAKEFDLNLIVVDLTTANNSIMTQVLVANKPNKPKYYHSIFTEKGMNNPVAIGGLRSCLRAPVLSYFALATKGLIVGTGNRSENKLIRYFQKFGDGCVDICPISDLFKSEVYELFAYMTNLIVTSDNISGQDAAITIYKATPTADLWGADAGQTDEEELGISYNEIEWADRQNITNNIITSEDDPTRHRSWAGYTLRQREVIAKIHQMEKTSRHKYNSNLPVCKIRKVIGLVK